MIPVYNASKFLRECLDSVLVQEVDDYEVILINDGSTDDSLSICNEYASKDSRFIVIDKKNEGPFIARSHGIKASRGKYLFFLDSDDFWDKDMLKIVDNALEKFNYPDIIVFNYNSIAENGNFLHKVRNDFPYDKSNLRANYPNDIFKILVGSDSLNSLWSKVIKRDVVDISKDSNFGSEITLGDDLIRTAPAIIKSQNIVFIDEYLYNYRKNTSSIVHNFNFKHFNSINIVYDYVLSELEREKDFNQELKILFNNRRVDTLISNINVVAISNTKIGEKKKTLIKIYEDERIQNLLYNFTNEKYLEKNKTKKITFWCLKHKMYTFLILVLKLRYNLFVKKRKNS